MLSYVQHLATAMVISMGVLLAPVAKAQQAPLPPIIRIVVPFTPGGSNDLAARLVAKHLGPRLDRPVIVENRPGGSTFIGATHVAQAPRDGSTLLCVSISIVTAAATKPTPPIDVMKDLVPVAMLGEGPLVVVASPKSGIRTLADLIAAARAKPDTLTSATPGAGSISHLSTELLADLAKVQIRHIPYKGGAPAVNDLLGGFVDLGISYSMAPLVPHIKSGKLHLVGVTSREPSPAFPGVPTVASVVPGFEVTLWVAIWVPGGTPVAIVQHLNREINEVVKVKEFVDLLQQDGATPLSLTPAEAADKVRRSYATWKDIATKKGITID